MGDRRGTMRCKDQMLIQSYRKRKRNEKENKKKERKIQTNKQIEMGKAYIVGNKKPSLEN